MRIFKKAMFVSVFLSQYAAMSFGFASADEIKVLYNGNTNLCNSIKLSYTQVVERYGPDSLISNVEDIYVEEFVKNGFVVPKYMDDENHPYGLGSGADEDDDADLVKFAFYREPIFGGSKKYELVIEDVPFTRQHYGYSQIYSSDVYLIKDGEDFSVTGGDISSREIGAYVPDENKISYGIIFSRGVGTEGRAQSKYETHLPYLFNKEDVSKRFSYWEDDKKGRVIKGLDVGLAGSGIKQRFFYFNGSPVFVARDVNTVLVYELHKDGITDLCYLGYGVVEHYH